MAVPVTDKTKLASMKMRVGELMRRFTPAKNATLSSKGRGSVIVLRKRKARPLGNREPGSCDAALAGVRPSSYWRSYSIKDIIARVTGLIALYILFVPYTSILAGGAWIPGLYELGHMAYDVDGRVINIWAYEALSAIMSLALICCVVCFSSRFTDSRSVMFSVLSLNPVRFVKAWKTRISPIIAIIPKRMVRQHEDTYTTKSKKDGYYKDFYGGWHWYVEDTEHEHSNYSWHVSEAEQEHRAKISRDLTAARFCGMSSLDHLPRLTATGRLHYDVPLDIKLLGARSWYGMRKLENTVTDMGIIGKLGDTMKQMQRLMLGGHLAASRIEHVPDDAVIVDMGLYSRGKFLNRIPVVAVEVDTDAELTAETSEALRHAVHLAVTLGIENVCDNKIAVETVSEHWVHGALKEPLASVGADHEGKGRIDIMIDTK